MPGDPQACTDNLKASAYFLDATLAGVCAITPQDWRVALGRAVLEEKAGDAEQAQASFVAASLAAPNDAVRAAIASRISPAANVSDDDLQLPLPKAVASSAH